MSFRNYRRALFRGEFVRCIALMEARGIPVDLRLFTALGEKWAELKRRVAMRANLRFPRCYDGTSFSEAGFTWWLRRNGYWWPTDASGELKLDGDTFDEMTAFFPEVRILRDARWIIRQAAASELAAAIGVDGRNRGSLMPFATKTGRCAPPTSSFILAAPAFMRFMIQAPPGHAILYADYARQEYWLSAVLSGDRAMRAAYEAGDPYWEFAKSRGAVPADAEVKDFEDVREVHKTTVLAVSYGQGPRSLARRLRVPLPYAVQLLDGHRRAYPRYWRWSNRVSTTMNLTGEMESALGWRIWLTSYTDNDLSIRNWPVQSLGSEILRVAVVLAFRAGLKVCAPLHDAMLAECRVEDLKKTEALLKAVMIEASAVVLGRRNELGVDVKSWIHPAHYFDKRGVDVWNEVRDLLGLT